MALFGKPIRVFVIQRTESRHPVISATCFAFLSSTRKICSWMPSDGDRHEYWIWLMRGGRLSDVHWPATMMNSLSVHVPVCGNMASFVYLVVVYMRHTASVAAGARATAWLEPANGARD